MNPFIKSLGIGILGSLLVTTYYIGAFGTATDILIRTADNIILKAGKSASIFDWILPPLIFSLVLVGTFLYKEKYKTKYDILKILLFIIIGTFSYMISVFCGLEFDKSIELLIAGSIGIFFFYIGFNILYFHQNQSTRLIFIFLSIFVCWILFCTITLIFTGLSMLIIQFFWQAIVLTGSAYIILARVETNSKI